MIPLPLKFTSFPIRQVVYTPYTHRQNLELYIEPIWRTSFTQNGVLALENAQGPSVFHGNYRITNELFYIL